MGNLPVWLRAILMSAAIGCLGWSASISGDVSVLKTEMVVHEKTDNRLEQQQKEQMGYVLTEIKEMNQKMDRIVENRK